MLRKALRRLREKLRRRNPKDLWENLFGTYVIDFSCWNDKDFREFIEGFSEEQMKGIEVLWEERKIRIGNISKKVYIRLARVRL